MKSVFLRASEISEAACGLRRFLNNDVNRRHFLSEGVSFKKYPWDFKVDEIPDDSASAASEHFINFTLWKKDLTTREALVDISKKTGISMKAWSVAGWKDRKAITTQRVSIQADLKEKLMQYLSNDSVRLSDFTPGNQLKPGQHRGNRFRITLRNFPFDKGSSDIADVEVLLQNVKKNGIFNYAGVQRFGAFGQAFRIGRHLIAERSDLAVGALLDPVMVSTGSSDRCILEEWHRSRDAHHAIASSSGGVREMEFALLKRLARSDCRHDFNRALRATIPKEHRRFYMHAYGCYVWNRMVSHYGIDVGDELPILGAGIPPEFFATRNGKLLQSILIDDGLVSPSEDLQVFCDDLGPRLMLMAKMRPVIIVPSDFTWQWVTHQPGEFRDLWQPVADAFATSVVREITGGLDNSTAPKNDETNHSR
ncbi:multisubstrate pseudouridine synthase 7 [Perkinsus chesapeaki]|uniref:Multisubstrate pseudouridine synthase 7 n=1 Tax=Perkinsus chesapeaki TaxID=330153 RepID=A0A7J6N5A1_PERCH|nr:multisubstrate pseudouridine synthase 7 [Perkinsus chesapeaki]